MTKTELINALAEETSSEKRQAKVFLEGLTTIVEKTIKKGGEVPMSGLGKFRVAKSAKDSISRSTCGSVLRVGSNSSRPAAAGYCLANSWASCRMNSSSRS